MEAVIEQLTQEEQEKFLKSLLEKARPIELITKPSEPVEQAKLKDDYIPPEVQDKYTPLEFLNSAEMLAFFEPNIREGRIKLHPWQIEESIRLSTANISRDDPLRYDLVAANGSGKDAYIIAPLCLFKLICRVRSRTVVTSSSNTQLKLQTENYIITLAELINKDLAEKGICQKAINIRRTPVTHLTCSLTGSEIVLFTTDETGRAEGWHPWPDSPNSEVTLIINEAKTVPDYIFDAFGRCTYTSLIEVSSPGQTTGRFYYNFLKSTVHPDIYKKGERFARRVTSYDCPHIARNKIEMDKADWGEASFLFRSRHLAQFTSLGESIVITTDVLDKCLNINYNENPDLRTKRIAVGLGLHAGVDLGALAGRGGDENTIYVFDENIYKDHIGFYETDANDLVLKLEEHFERFGLEKKSIINIDDGRIGSAIISNLRNRGWNINNVANQSSATNRLIYLNKGAELWFNFKRLVEEAVVVLPSKESNLKLYEQLTTRRYEGTGHQGKLFLEDKKMAKKSGARSPDHADAVILAFAGYTIHDFLKGKVEERAGNFKAIFNVNAVVKQETNIERLKLHLRTRDREIENKSSGMTGFNPGNILRSLYGK